MKLLKDLVSEWHTLKLAENRAKESRHDVEAEIYLQLKEDLKEDGSTTFNLDDYKLVVKQDCTVKVDQDKAANNPEYFKTKYEMSYSQFKKLENKNLVEDMITITPSKPSFSVESK